jgi:hypothetical protein
MTQQSELERRLRAAAQAGEWLDLRGLPDRQVSAELLYALLVEDGPSRRPRAVKLSCAQVIGSLDLEATTVRCPLHLSDCEFTEPVVLREAIAPSIRLIGCILGPLSADQLETRGDLELAASTITGEVSVLGARIGGQLSFAGAKLANDGGPALNASGVQVDLGMYCWAVGEQRFTATGEVRLVGAHIGGQLNFNGAELANDRGPALNANGLDVDLGMYCQAVGKHRFTATGGISLVGAHIGGQLSFNGAELANDSGPALHADRMRVDQGMFCRTVGEHRFTAHGMRLLGAHIGGQLNFNGADLANDTGSALDADGLQVDGDMVCDAVRGQPFTAMGEVRLLGAHIGGQLSFDGAELASDSGPALHGDNLRVDQGMFCRAVGEHRFTATGEVNLVAAHIAGAVSFEGAELANDSGPALNGSGLRVDQGMFCRPVGEHRFTATGEVRLLAAHIGGQLSFAGAELANASGPALNAFDLQVDQGMYCWPAGEQRFTATGGVNLVRAHIGGQLSFAGAELANDTGNALNASGVQVDQGMYCDAVGEHRFAATGGVNLFGAHIAGQLSFEGAEIANGGGGLVLDLESARVDAELFMGFVARPVGGIDLTASGLGRVFDSEATWPTSLRLRGCVYSDISAMEDAESPGAQRRLLTRLWWRIRPRSSPDVHRRLRWIRLAEDGGVAASDHDGYAPQPYTQLMTYYRREGRDGDARRVGFERERRRRSQLHAPGQVWNLFLRLTVGYGYKPLRALLLLGMLLIVGTLVFTSLHGHGEIQALKTSHPPFVALIYTLDRLIPVVSFGLRDDFALRAAAQWWAFAYTLLGWALTVAVLAGLNAAVRRD